MKKILVATDFSEAAMNATRFATEIARITHAEIILLNTFSSLSVSEASVDSGNLTAYQTQKKMKENELKHQSEMIRASHYLDTDTPIICSYRTNLSDPVYAIKKISQETVLDLIVIGNIGIPDSTRYYKSTAIELMDQLHLPVLVVPPTSGFNGFKNIAYATELVGDELKVIKPLADFIIWFKSNLTLLHVTKEESREELTELRKRIESELQTVIKEQTVESEDIVESIEKYVNKSDTDLLILWKHERNFFESFVHRSVTKALVRTPGIPLLLLNLE